jgi:hypothetical protein
MLNCLSVQIFPNDTGGSPAIKTGIFNVQNNYVTVNGSAAVGSTQPDPASIVGGIFENFDPGFTGKVTVQGNRVGNGTDPLTSLKVNGDVAGGVAGTAATMLPTSGTFDTGSAVTNNHVDITLGSGTSTISGQVGGGASYGGGDIKGNTVTITQGNGGTLAVSGRIQGGANAKLNPTDGGVVGGLNNGNTVKLSTDNSGTITAQNDVIGGLSLSSGVISYNEVTIGSGVTVKQNVGGGWAGILPLTPSGSFLLPENATDDQVSHANVTDNKVWINSGSVEGKVHGGVSQTGAAENNHVYINGGSVGGISGGYVQNYGGGGDNGATGNTVTITGGTVSADGNIYGGEVGWNAKGGNSGGAVTKNEVNITSSATAPVNDISGDIVGGITRGTGKVGGFDNGNTVTIDTGTGTTLALGSVRGGRNRRQRWQQQQRRHIQHRQHQWRRHDHNRQCLWRKNQRRRRRFHRQRPEQGKRERHHRQRPQLRQRQLHLQRQCGHW